MHDISQQATAPKLSVTVLDYNYAHYLPKCLDSILSQTMRDFEVLLINDCSTDNSREVIHPYLRDPRIRLIDHEHNQGYVRSLLEGCEFSRGEYITVISADDWALDNTAFERACRTLDGDKDIAFVYSAWKEIDDKGHERHTRRSAEHDYVASGVDELRQLLFTSPVLHSGTLIRRSAYHEVGGYDSRCRYSVDTNMWLALCSVGKVAYLDTPLYAYRAHGDNMSNSVGSLWQATEEMLLGIDTALARFSDSQIPNKGGLRRGARQRALVAVPTLDIFAGRLRRGWLAYWLACKRYPYLTIVQARTATLIIRTVLGQHGYENVRHGVKAFTVRLAHA